MQLNQNLIRFSHIKEHQHVHQQLIQRARQQRLGQAYLFCGVEGIGKKATARALFAWLNCLNNHDLKMEEACGECAECCKARSGNHPDWLDVSSQKQVISVQTVRQQISQLAYHRFSGRYRFIVVDNAHTLNIAAANALLKGLEEPPPHSIFILISSAPSLLPATVISRCQRIRFAPLSQESLSALLNQEHSVDRLDDVMLALSQGSLSLARNLYEKGIMQDFLALQEPFQQLLLAQKQDNYAALELAEKIANYDDPDILLHLFQSLCRYHIIPEWDNYDLRQRYFNAWEKLEEARVAIKGQANPLITLESMLLQIQPEAN